MDFLKAKKGGYKQGIHWKVPVSLCSPGMALASACFASHDRIQERLSLASTYLWAAMNIL